MIKLKIKKHQLVLAVVAFGIGLVLAVMIFNHRQDGLVKFDVTWTDAHQALIFWKTPKLTTGYIKYGMKSTQLTQTATQTNEQASNLHVVVLENLPAAGTFITLHSETESFLRHPKAIHIKYEESSL